MRTTNVTRDYWADKVLPEFGREGHTGTERTLKVSKCTAFFSKMDKATAAARRVELEAGIAVLRHKE